MLGGFMLTGIPWALPALGGDWQYESKGVFGLLCSTFVCLAVSLIFWRLGRGMEEYFSKKDAIAVVGLSWILATLLGALPYLLAGACRAEGVPMNVFDALFETQSGFSTTGATVFSTVERPDLLPRCILFWRLSTHFLGGLGIMILFVVLLGYGTGTAADIKGVVRSEMTGPSRSSPSERIRYMARIVFTIYVFLNIIQTTLLYLQGLTLFDALCHSFSTVSTGGLSTFDASAGHFASHGYPHAATIEWTLITFMILGGTNFILLYWVFKRQPKKLYRDPEWRTYIGVIMIATTVIFISGTINRDFDNFGTSNLPSYVPPDTAADPTEIVAPQRTDLPAVTAFRVSVFQVVSILTTTGLCTDEYEKWSGLSCGIILLLMFLGGCAGSTSGGFKMIRFVCLMKALPQEIERAFRPNVVRPILVGGTPMDRDIVRQIMIHFVMLTTIFIVGTFLVLLLEPLSTWGTQPVAGDRKLIDTASAVASCLNNVGPGLGLIGARQNFGVFSEASKFIFTWLMMIGRLEMFVILSLFQPGFWRK